MLAGVQIRDSVPEPQRHRPVGPAQPTQWRVDPKLPTLKGAAAVIVALVALFVTNDRVGLILGLLAAVGLCLWAARDALVPVRLAADTEGVTVVVGVARRRRLAWAQIDRVRVDRQQRYGLRTEYLELDAGEELHMLSAHDLGVPAEEAADVLARLRGQARRAGGGHDTQHD
jgi:hypothetical protein